MDETLRRRGHSVGGLLNSLVLLGSGTRIGCEPPRFECKHLSAGTLNSSAGTLIRVQGREEKWTDAIL